MNQENKNEIVVDSIHVLKEVFDWASKLKDEKESVKNNLMKISAVIVSLELIAEEEGKNESEIEINGYFISDPENINSSGKGLHLIQCWSCNKTLTRNQHSQNDGYCPHCNNEIDLSDGYTKSPLD